MVLFYMTKSHVQIDSIKILEDLHHFKPPISKALTYFYPLAGRIKDDSFVYCNDEGIPFKEAQVKCRLSDFLQDPDPTELNEMFPFPSDDAAELPMGIQLNTFGCGGIGIGLCISQKIVDGLSFFRFLSTWAAIARGDQKNMVLPDLASDKLFPLRNISIPEPEIDTNQKNIVTKRLVFSASKIEEIRAKYAAGSGDQTRASRIKALSVFIWSRFIASTRKKSSPDSLYAIIHTVNLRTRFEPPLPAQSFGNSYRVTVTVPSMVEEQNGYNLVRQIRDSIRKIDKEYVKKLQVSEDLFDPLVDEGDESFKKVNRIPFIFTSLCRFPVYEADFGWGKPIWVSSANLTTKNLVVFMDTASGDGIEAWINLKEEDMAEFEYDEELLANCNT